MPGWWLFLRSGLPISTPTGSKRNAMFEEGRQRDVEKNASVQPAPLPPRCTVPIRLFMLRVGKCLKRNGEEVNLGCKTSANSVEIYDACGQLREIHRCHVAEACTGGRWDGNSFDGCAYEKGYTGPLCKLCRKGFRRDGGRCTTCKAQGWGKLLIQASLLILLLLIPLIIVRSKLARMPSVWRDVARMMNILVGLVQVQQTLLDQADVRYPQLFRDFIGLFSVFTDFDVLSFTGAGCVASVDFRFKFLAMAIIPLNVILLNFAVFCWSEKKRRQKFAKKSKEDAEAIFEDALRLAFEYTDDDDSGELDPNELVELFASIGHTVTLEGCIKIVECFSEESGTEKHGLTSLEFIEIFRDTKYLALLAKEERKVTIVFQIQNPKLFLKIKARTESRNFRLRFNEPSVGFSPC